MSPTILVHGNSNCGEWWADAGFTVALDTNRIVYDDTLDFDPPASTIAGNADQILDHVEDTVQRFGADSCHLVAHSKGGLDARMFLRTYLHSISFWNPTSGRRHGVDVVSLTTLSTPHDGSLLADLMVQSAAAGRGKVFFRYRGEPAIGSILAGKQYLEGSNKGYEYLTLDAVRKFNRRNARSLPKNRDYAAARADMDQNGNDMISISEAAGLHGLMIAPPCAHHPVYPNVFPFTASDVAGGAEKVYLFLKYTSRITVAATALSAIVTGFRGGPFPNDTLVTLDSGFGVAGGYDANLTQRWTFSGVGGAFPGKNHQSIGDQQVGHHVAFFLPQAEQRHGDLK